MTRRTAPAVTGLIVAWGGTALLVSPVARFLADPESSAAGILGQAALWLLCVVVIGIVVLWEKRPLASLWVRPFQWQSIAWAGVLIVVHFVVLFPATEWVRARNDRRLGLGYRAVILDLVVVKCLSCAVRGA